MNDILPDESQTTRALEAALVFVRDEADRILYWSRGLEDFYGFPASEALGRPAHELLKTQFPSSRTEIEAGLRHSGTWSGELLQTCGDGATIAVAVHWALVRNPQGAQITETCIDVSEHRRRADYLAAIVQSSDDAIMGKTLEGVITSWNKAAETMLGFAAEEIIGQPVTAILPRDRLREEEFIMNEIKRGNSISHHETLRRHKDGQEIAISLTVSPIRASGERIIGASSILRDISERRMAEERFHRMQSELAHMGRLSEMGQMASALAHELNQPLTATGNYIAAARRSLPAAPERALDSLVKAGQQVIRAGEIIRRLRGFLSKAEPEKQTTAIERLIEDTAALAQIDAKFRDIQLRFDFHAGEALADVDRVQFQQVLFNLLRTAFEATTGRPVRTVGVSTEHRGTEIEIGAADSGCGAAPAVAGILFRPPGSTKESGRGVGLSICRTIVENMSGRIWHQPSPLGGAMFLFTVPLA